MRPLRERHHIKRVRGLLSETQSNAGEAGREELDQNRHGTMVQSEHATLPSLILLGPPADVAGEYASK